MDEYEVSIKPHSFFIRTSKFAVEAETKADFSPILLRFEPERFLNYVV